MKFHNAQAFLRLVTPLHQNFVEFQGFSGKSNKIMGRPSSENPGSATYITAYKTSIVSLNSKYQRVKNFTLMARMHNESSVSY